MVLLGICLFVMSAESFAQVTDRSGNQYKTETIGVQVWMTENLNSSLFRNGDAIPEAKTYEEWEKAGEEGKPAWCYYENIAENGKQYGKLYNWYAVNDARGLAPQGWHIPSDEEWTMLAKQLGGEEAATTKLKSITGWEENKNSTNESGFNGLPSGIRNMDGEFDEMGFYGYWWSATQEDADIAFNRNLSSENFPFGKASGFKKMGLSVRCLKD